MRTTAIAFPVPDPHFAFVRTRRRNSGLTSVRWYDDETLFAADFSAKAVYRVCPFTDNPIDASISTLDGSGCATSTDLMDCRGDMMVMTNFYTGEVGFYTIGRHILRFDRVICPHVPGQWLRNLRSLLKLVRGNSNVPRRRRAHGIRFVPGYEDLLWVSYCDARVSGIEIVTSEGRTVHSLRTPEQAQDVAFIEHDGVTYAVQAARTDHISADGPREVSMYATLYVYRLPDNLKQEPPLLMTTEHFSGHIDALKEFRGRVYGANQHDDCVDEFVYLPDNNSIKLLRRIEGFDMPHGIDIRHDGLMAVTNYGDKNDLRFVQL